VILSSDLPEPGDDAAPVTEDVTPIVRLSDDEFRVVLGEAIPHLRAFSRSLTGGVESADDLVQETLLKAWSARDRFAAGTSMRAWTFIILRNLFLSDARRSRFRGEWDDATADRILLAPEGQTGSVELSDLYRAMASLPPVQREALVLIGAGGFSYEEAAEICDVAVGTIKSRVARARATLATVIEHGDLDRRSSDDLGGANAMSEILAEVDNIVGR
jgi:RNA polymerase sigma-70 factor, ECF subfamily